MYLIPVLFGLIHFIEFASYLSRIAGLKVGYPLLGYSFQQMFFVGTRFLFIALMPLIGFMVDTKTSTNEYIYMLFLSMICATLGYIVVFLFKKSIIKKICYFILKKTSTSEESVNLYNDVNIGKILNNKKTIFFSALVFCCYSLGVFIAFYFALVFYEYRTTLSQMSGIVNGLATVLLTFVIEPKLAKSFDDKNPDAINLLFSVLLGRFIGVSIFSQLVIFILYIWN